MIDETTRTQIGRFLAVGVLSTIADYGTYQTLLATVLADQYSLAKAASFLVGTTVSYLLNTYWTFESKGKPPPGQTRNFVILYGLTFVINVAVNAQLVYAALAAGMPEWMATTTAFVLATAVSTVMNFLGQKFWVFKR